MGGDETEVVVQILERAGVELAPGLSEDELIRIETTLGFTFGSDHRELLKATVPVGEYWANWRDLSDPYLQWQLTWPVEGPMYDVARNTFWLSEWGARPVQYGAALAMARSAIEKWPRLVPIHHHRYTVAASRSGSPLLSINQTDVIFCGADLNDYVRRDFGGGWKLDLPEIDASGLYPWSELARWGTLGRTSE